MHERLILHEKTNAKIKKKISRIAYDVLVIFHW